MDTDGKKKGMFCRSERCFGLNPSICYKHVKSLVSCTDFGFKSLYLSCFKKTHTYLYKRNKKKPIYNKVEECKLISCTDPLCNQNLKKKKKVVISTIKCKFIYRTFSEFRYMKKRKKKKIIMTNWVKLLVISGCLCPITSALLGKVIVKEV